MVNYKELGLVNTRDMFARAIKGGYAIPAFNFNNLEQLQAIIKASSELKSPVILQVSKGARNYANETLLRYMAEGAVEYAKELGCKHPEIVLHLDHGDSFELCKSCVDLGFSSVMIDGSSLPYEENIALTRKVVEYAHQFDVTVEAELGVLAGVEDEVCAAESHYTKPEEVIDFATRTGCDSLAISIGTSHGAHKFTPEQCTLVNGVLVPPPLAFDVLAEIEKKLPGFPIVLHGSSSVPMEEVNTINKFGGDLKAELTANEIFEIRDSRTQLARGEADFMPKDGTQLKLMMSQLDTQEKALMQVFSGVTTKDTTMTTITYLPTSEVEKQPLFRFSKYYGIVDNDDLSGSPYYIKVAKKKTFDDEPAAADGKKDKKEKKDKNDIGLRVNIPAKMDITIFNGTGNTLAKEQSPHPYSYHRQWRHYDPGRSQACF